MKIKKSIEVIPPSKLLDGDDKKEFFEFLRTEIVGHYGVLNIKKTIRKLVLQYGFIDKQDAFSYLHHLAIEGILVPIKKVASGKKSNLNVLMGLKIPKETKDDKTSSKDV